jgi:hypothetical protein
MDPIAQRVADRVLAFSTNPKAIKPQFKKLDEALKHLEHAKGELTEGPNFHAYSNAIDAFREVVYFLEHAGTPDEMAGVQHKFPHLAIMSKNPFDPAKAVSEAHGGKLFEQALAEAKHLETAYEHAHKAASLRGVDAIALRVAASHYVAGMRRKSSQALYNHHSPETAYMVDDYPYGRKLRCRIRYWLESGGSKGFRFCSQTEDPRNLHWNNPKKSTYMPLAACMFLDEQHHVTWNGLSEYSDGGKVLDFVKTFPHADYSILKVFTKHKIKYLELAAQGKAVWTINGVPQPVTEEDMGRHSKELESWHEVEKHIH